MPRPILELTDPRFLIPANADVMSFVQEGNSSAHSDVGSVLFSLGRQIDGAEAYCPVPSSFTYVVLHTASRRIFAIAYGMRGLAFRVAPPAFGEAIADGAVPVPRIGADWVTVEPWDSRTTAGAEARLLRWARRAHADAIAAPAVDAAGFLATS